MRSPNCATRFSRPGKRSINRKGFCRAPNCGAVRRRSTQSDRRRPRTGCRRSGDGAAGHRSSHRNQTPQMPLTRLKDSAFDAQVEGVYFGMWNGSIPVRCLVSREALTDKAEGASLAESLDVFHEYRSEIENLAGVKYDAGQIKSDGLVVVDSPDLNPEQISTGVSLILEGLTR